MTKSLYEISLMEICSKEISSTGICKLVHMWVQVNLFEGYLLVQQAFFTRWTGAQGLLA